MNVHFDRSKAPKVRPEAPTPSLQSPNSFRVVLTLCLVASNCFSASHPRPGDDADVRTDRGDERHHGKWSFPSSLPPTLRTDRAAGREGGSLRTMDRQAKL